MAENMFAKLKALVANGDLNSLMEHDEEIKRGKMDSLVFLASQENNTRLLEHLVRMN